MNLSDQDENLDTPTESINLKNVSIEDLVKLAEKQLNDESNAIKAEKVSQSKESRKKRADREYEEYWRKRAEEPKNNSKSSKNKEKAIAREYYSFRNTDNLERLSKVNNFELVDNTNRPVSKNEMLIIGLLYFYRSIAS